MIRLIVPSMGEEEVSAVARVLESGYLTQGPRVEEFENLIAECVGTDYAFATSSCTTALHLCLAATGIGTGDEVLVPDFTFPATANVVVQQGAVPVLVDIDPVTFTMDAEDMQRKISAQTKAVMPVHAFGLSADMDPIMELAQKNGLAVIEDAACALGATYKGRACGSIGLAGCFSFHPRKSITTGEGGAITTSDEALAERIRLLRSHGGVRREGRFTFEAAGFNYRLSDILGAVGVVQMGKLEQILNERHRLAGELTSRFAGTAGLAALPSDQDYGEHTYQSYVAILEPGLNRDAVIDEMRSRGVETTLGTYALHMQPFFAKEYGYSRGDLPNSFGAYERSLTLPLYAGMDSGALDSVAVALRGSLEAMCRQMR